MYEDFFANRIAALRISKDISARDMSLSLGQNPSYINRIENKQAFPSMKMFLYICEYFNITPKEFFDIDNTRPLQNKAILKLIDKLDDNDVELVIKLLETLSKK